MEFLKWYSGIVLGFTTIVCLLDPSSPAFLGGVMFVPIAVYAWKIIIDKKI